MSCNKKTPSYCEDPFQITEISLVPSDVGFGGDTVVIKNDSLIVFITQQLCNINKEESYYSSGIQGLRHNIEIRIAPDKLPKGQKLFVAFNQFGESEYVLREGENSYFKNDILCELVARLTNTYVGVEKLK